MMLALPSLMISIRPDQLGFISRGARGSQCVVKCSEGSLVMLELTPRANACGLAVSSRLNTFFIWAPGNQINNDGLRACNRPTGEGREALENRPLLLLRRMARAQDRPRASSTTGPACW